MLQLERRWKASARPYPLLDVDILAVATATPRYKLAQVEAFERAKVVFPALARLEGLYLNTGIETRYSCVPADWCHECHGWEERTAIFQREALDLSEDVAGQAIRAAGLEPSDIDVVVSNTITGLAVPSLEAMLINRMAFRETVTRLPIFGFGCGGGVAGLSRAAQLARALPGANVLFLTVELCSLCMRPNDSSLAMYVSAALFGDGAAAVVLRSADGAREGASGAAASGRSPAPRIRAAGERCWRGTEHILGWDIKDDGFGMVLSPALPTLMREELAPAVREFLDRHGWALEDFSGFLLHPGGRKILETAEEVLGLERAHLAHSWAILRDYGNMSSATVLFMLERAMHAGDRGRHLMAAFGPGFSAYFMAVDLYGG